MLPDDQNSPAATAAAMTTPRNRRQTLAALASPDADADDFKSKRLMTNSFPTLRLPDCHRGKQLRGPARKKNVFVFLILPDSIKGTFLLARLAPHSATGR
jgi:hypothetical protein